jgi:hypothetical protein
MTSHASKALDAIASAEEAMPKGQGNKAERAAIHARIAQAYATLALAEAQSPKQSSPALKTTAKKKKK